MVFPIRYIPRLSIAQRVGRSPRILRRVDPDCFFFHFTHLLHHF